MTAPVQPTDPVFAWIFEHTHKPPNRFVLVWPSEYATAYRDTCIRQIPLYAQPPVQPTDDYELGFGHGVRFADENLTAKDIHPPVQPTESQQTAMNPAALWPFPAGKRP